MKKKKQPKKIKLIKLLKASARKDFMLQGGNDGRFREKVVPDKKKKYNRQKVKNIDTNSLGE